MAKILLVEDDTNLSEIYQARMEAEGYEVVAAPDGETALAVAAKEKPDLILSDVMMPKISGFEMLDILRNTEGLKHTKVIMLTALGQAEDQARAEKLGADKYLVKSQVTLEDIVTAAQELLNDSGVPAPAALAAATDNSPNAEATPEAPATEPAVAAPAGPLAATTPAAVPAPTAAAEPAVAADPALAADPVATSDASMPVADPAATSTDTGAGPDTDESSGLVAAPAAPSATTDTPTADPAAGDADAPTTSDAPATEESSTTTTPELTATPVAGPTTETPATTTSESDTAPPVVPMDVKAAPTETEDAAASTDNTNEAADSDPKVDGQPAVVAPAIVNEIEQQAATTEPQPTAEVAPLTEVLASTPAEVPVVTPASEDVQPEAAQAAIEPLTETFNPATAPAAITDAPAPEPTPALQSQPPPQQITAEVATLVEPPSAPTTAPTSVAAQPAVAPAENAATVAPETPVAVAPTPEATAPEAPITVPAAAETTPAASEDAAAEAPPTAIDEQVVANAVDKLLSKAPDKPKTENPELADAALAPGHSSDEHVRQKVIAPPQHPPEPSLQDLLAKEEAKNVGSTVTPTGAPESPADPPAAAAAGDDANAAAELAQAQAANQNRTFAGGFNPNDVAL